MTGMRRFLAETGTLIAAAVVCALVANAVAAKEKKLALVGKYPNALKVPGTARTESSAPPIAADPGAPPTSMPPAVNGSGPASSSPGEPIGPIPPVSSSPSASPAATPRTTPSPAAASPKPAASSGKAELLARFAPHKDKAYIEIRGEDVAWLHARGVLFLDARRTSVYQQGHIAGARPFSVWESDVGDKVQGLLDEGRDLDLPIVIYCSGGDCEDSHMLAEKLWGVFFANVLVYKDGWPDWQQRGGRAE